VPLESYHNTPPDASFSGTGSSAWVEAHNLRMEGGGFLVGRETAGTGAPENIAIGANLTLSGGTLSASGGTAAAGVSLVQGVAPILVGGTATSTVSLATSGVTAGTYGGPLVIPRFDVSAQGLIQSASQAGTIGTMASFNSYVAAGDALGTSTTGTLTVALSTTGVTAGTYGNGTAVSQVVVDAKGRVTSASNVNISFPAAGGTSTFALAGDVLGTGLVPGTLTSALSTTGITAGTYGGTAGIPRFDIDAKGRMLSAASHPLQGSAPIAITTGAGTFVVSHNTSGVAAGTYGDGTAVAQVVVNALGHLTAGTSVPITFPTVRVLEATAPIAVATAAGTYTVSHNTSGISAGTYGGTLGVARFGVSAEGHVTAAANHALEATAPILLATNAGTFAWSHGTSGVAAGTFGTGNDLVQLTVNALGHVTSVATSGTIGTMGRFASYTLAGDVLGTSTTSTFTAALSTTGVSAGTYGNGTAVGQFVVDAKGRVTLATNVTISASGGGITLGTRVLTTAGTSANFTIPAGAKRVTVIGSEVSSNGTSGWIVQIGGTGGFVETGYTGGLSIGAAVASITTGFGIFESGGIAAASAYNFTLNINLIDPAAFRWVSSGLAQDTGGLQSARIAVGGQVLASELTQLRFIAINKTDTFDGGSVNVAVET